MGCIGGRRGMSGLIDQWRGPTQKRDRIGERSAPIGQWGKWRTEWNSPRPNLLRIVEHNLFIGKWTPLNQDANSLLILR